jgi:hypothetical protein
MREDIARSSANVLLTKSSAPAPVVAVCYGSLASRCIVHAKRTKIAIPLAVERGMDGLSRCRGSKQEKEEEGFHGLEEESFRSFPSIVLTREPLVNPCVYQCYLLVAPPVFVSSSAILPSSSAK